MELLSDKCEQKKVQREELEKKYDDILKSIEHAEQLMESLKEEKVRLLLTTYCTCQWKYYILECASTLHFRVDLTITIVHTMPSF